MIGATPAVVTDVRILFFGMDCAFSHAPLAALIAHHTVCGVVLPRPAGLRTDPPLRRLAPPSHPSYHFPFASLNASHKIQILRPLPSAPAPGVPQLAWEAGVPVLEAGDLRDAGTRADLAALRPDLICVACFSRLLPAPLIDLAPRGAVNLHPSLLPRYRGPAPLFWIFHDGLEHAGVTVHALDEGADTGPLLAQRPLGLPDGIDYRAAESACAEVGADLLLCTMAAIEAGTAAPRPQPPGAWPPAPWPADADYLISPAWPARRAFNFIRGAAGQGRPIRIVLDGEDIPIAAALSFAPDTTLPVPARREGRRLLVRCSPGTLAVLT